MTFSYVLCYFSLIDVSEVENVLDPFFPKYKFRQTLLLEIVDLAEIENFEAFFDLYLHTSSQSEASSDVDNSGLSDSFLTC